MGFSISVPCKSEAARDFMCDFMAEHYRPLSTLLGRTTLLGREGRKPDYVKYARTENHIGFENPNDYEVQVMRWMALQVGARRRFGAEVFPRLDIDGKSSSYIALPGQVVPPGPFTVKRGYSVEFILVDELGWNDPEPQKRLLLGKVGWLALGSKYRKEFAAFRPELVRLNELWGEACRK